MQKIFLVVGVPGSGKTTLCSKLIQKYEYLPHDDFESEISYIKAANRLQQIATKPLLLEAPFSVSIYTEALEVIPVFIIEEDAVVSDRYFNRDKKPIPKGHLTRQCTYKKRATELNAFFGTADQVFRHLDDLAAFNITTL